MYIWVIGNTKRQALNVFRMNLLGATVHPITSGTGTLKDADKLKLCVLGQQMPKIHFMY